MKRKLIITITCVLFFINLSAQTNTGHIEGVVLTIYNKPMPEVNIVLKELKKYSRTNEDGHFKFRNIPFGKYTLVYSFAGLAAREVAVTVPPEESATSVFQLPLHTKEMEEIIITYKKGMNRGAINIGKAGIAIMDLPQSVSIIDESTITMQQAQRLSDVVKNINGVYLGSQRAGTQETLYARGYNFSNTNLFKNGFRINTGAMPEMSGIESVEVLKGSAAILYGNVAPGGIVNMVTKKPKFNFGGELNMRMGSFDLYKPSVDFYGPLSKHIAFRVNGTFEKANSFRDVVHSNRFYINPSILFKLSKNTELLLQADFLKHNFTPDFGIGTLADSVIADVPRSRFMGASWQNATTQQTVSSAELNHQFNNNWKLNAGVAYQDYSRDYFSLERIQAKANGDWGRPIGKTYTHEKYFTGQINITGKFNTHSIKHNALAGLDADRYFTTLLTSDIERKIYDSINLLDPLKFNSRTAIPTARWATNTETPLNRLGIYIQDLVSITHNLKLLAGLRWSLLQAAAVETTYFLKNDSVGLSNQQSDKAFSPRLGLVYQPTKNTSLFASYSNSFLLNTGTDIHFNLLPPSIIDQYEVGVKNDFFNGKANMNMTLYRIINNNLVQMAPFAADGKPNSNSNLRELTGQTTSDGLEIDLKSAPANGLEAMAGYSYNYMRYTRTSDKNGAYVKGQKVVNTPAHTANATVFYTVQDGALKRLKLGAGLYYMGERIAGWNYTVDNKRPLFPVKAFVTVDVSAGYSYKRMSLIAKAANIFNTYNYYVHENYSVNPIPPRNCVVTLGYRF